jgi:hypothetical protein
MGWMVNSTPRPLYLLETPGTHCTGGWVGPRASLDGCGKCQLRRDLIPGSSSPLRVAVPAHNKNKNHRNNNDGDYDNNNNNNNNKVFCWPVE